jgi:hypothetical protein
MEISCKYTYTGADWEQEQAQRIQALFDGFVAIRSGQLEDLITAESYRNGKAPNAEWLKQYVLEILVKNDNLYTVADYVRQGSKEYYWYSDFLDSLDREDKKKYFFYDTTGIAFSKSGFDKCLRSVELPYFQEIVELVSALAAIKELEPKQPEAQILPKEPESEPTLVSRPTFKSTLTPEQTARLTDTINEVKLFKNAITPEALSELLSGERKEKLHTTNTKLVYYLFEKLSQSKYIALDWWDIFLRNAILVSTRGNIVENQDFRGAKQRVFAEYEGILPKKHHIIDECLEELDDLHKQL